MRQPDPDKGYWRCDPCQVVQELLGYGISITHIAFQIRGQEYSVRLDGKNLSTQFTRWQGTNDGFYIGEVILSIDGLADITPSNVIEKIKLYMVFS